jgi:hypothetical protein
LSPEAQVNNGRFHGTDKPRYVIENELPWHRMAAHMFGVAGMVTIKDVAEACDVDPGTVSNLLKQPWFQERVTSLMAKNGRDIMQLFRAEQFNSFLTLIEVRDDPETSRKDKIVCAKDILDRTLGKPIQRIESTDIPTSGDPVAEVARLELELK